ncbi:UNVERIFIED_CONTAM: hypothetical protein Sradi_5865400 [Sesamum radiatum]|uniref:Uncharacterized protein n=1 Tax=Sesamum radiatum TaxID=300843 RepID=A0AAW2KSP1_SESRA
MVKLDEAAVCEEVKLLLLHQGHSGERGEAATKNFRSMCATNRGEVVVGNMVSDDGQRQTVAIEWASSTYLGCARWRCGRLWREEMELQRGRDACTSVTRLRTLIF